MAGRLKQRLPPHVDLDDLIAAGNLGLAQALANGQVGEPGAFEAYALQRASGAMLDELRGNDQLTRGQRRLAKRLAQIEKGLAQQLGRQPASEEIAEALGMSAGDLAEARRRTARHDHVSISVAETHTLSHSSIRPDAMLDAVRRAEKLRGAMTQLPGRLKVVVDLSCGEELTLREIGKRLGVTEARVCQLRQEAVRRLRTSCNEGWSSASAA
jgi:RNA polymerase sigma factor for flagellar operon FliA